MYFSEIVGGAQKITVMSDYYFAVLCHMEVELYHVNADLTRRAERRERVFGEERHIAAMRRYFDFHVNTSVLPGNQSEILTVSPGDMV
jgi:hypothetical protein